MLHMITCPDMTLLVAGTYNFYQGNHVMPSQVHTMATRTAISRWKLDQFVSLKKNGPKHPRRIHDGSHLCVHSQCAECEVWSRNVSRR